MRVNFVFLSSKLSSWTCSYTYNRTFQWRDFLLITVETMVFPSHGFPINPSIYIHDYPCIGDFPASPLWWPDCTGSVLVIHIPFISNYSIEMGMFREPIYSISKIWTNLNFMTKHTPWIYSMYIPYIKANKLMCCLDIQYSIIPFIHFHIVLIQY